ncbi:MAG: calcium/sodium antiporter [Candidatus Methylacidiphilales bacterium]
MISDFSLLLAGLLLLFFGAEGLVRGATALSLRAGISPLVVGLTVLAFSTSSPELVVSVKAAWQGNGAIAIGNVIGSNIANSGLILGLSAIIFPLAVQRSIIRREIPVMLGLTFVTIYFLYDGSIARWEGVLLLVFLVAYVVYTVRVAKKSGDTATAEEIESVSVQLGRHWGIDAALLVGGLGILVLGAELMVTAAISIATKLGAPQVFIGLTIVALGTSLPELATSVVAAWKKEVDLLVGNLIGSNIFNIAGILGTSSMLKPLINDGVTSIDLILFALFSLCLLPIMKSGYRITRLEGGLLLAAYVGYIGFLSWQLKG